MRIFFKADLNFKRTYSAILSNSTAASDVIGAHEQNILQSEIYFMRKSCKFTDKRRIDFQLCTATALVALHSIQISPVKIPREIYI